MDKVVWKRMATSIAIGVCAGLIILVAGSILAAWLIHTEKASEESIGSWVTVVQIVAWVTACLTSVLLTKERKLIASVAAAVSLFVLQLIISMLLLEGEMDGIVSMLLIAVFTGLGIGILSNRPKKRKTFPGRK